MDTPSLRAYADAVADRGVRVVRFNLPYVEAGRRAPGPRARDEACWRDVGAFLRPRAVRLVIGGRSYGGRMASHVVAEGAPCDGLVLLAYPLHPPGKPGDLRTAHLASIRVPTLFLSGTRDAFATWPLLSAAVASMPAATLHAVDGADHSHAVRGRPVAAIAAELADATIAWLSTSSL